MNYTEIKQIRSKGIYAYYSCQSGKDTYILKGLKLEYQSRKQFAHLLQREYKQCSALNHEGIVKYIDLIETENQGTCIVLEYINGRSLKEYIQERHSGEEKFAVLHQLASAVDYLHKNKVVHGNLKPSNILITNQGDQVKLIDFRFLDPDESGEQSISLKYLAPELRDGTMTVDGYADIYSIGMLLKDMNLGSMATKVIERCCSFGRYERYEQAEDAIQALEHGGDHGGELNLKLVGGIVGAAVIVLAIFLAVTQFGGDVTAADGTAQTDSTETVASENGDASANGNAAYADAQASAPAQTPAPDQAAATVENQPAATTASDAVNQIQGAVTADLDKIFDPYINGVKQGYPGKQVARYYKGILRVYQLKGADLEAFDKFFADYINGKKAQLKK